jgi:bis(5'-nucleosidyl)-tetraphosphatase/histidine triad (HIT) family protein
MYSENCVFCRDVIRDRKASIVYENDQVMAFMDIAPVEPGHVLVVPRDHYANIMDIDEPVYLEVHRVTRMISPAVVRAVGADAVNIGQNNGACANQRVFHYHVHIIPRFCSRELNWGRRTMEDEELEQMAVLIRNEIADRVGRIPELR